MNVRNLSLYLVCICTYVVTSVTILDTSVVCSRRHHFLFFYDSVPPVPSIKSPLHFLKRNLPHFSLPLHSQSLVSYSFPGLHASCVPRNLQPQSSGRSLTVRSPSLRTVLSNPSVHVSPCTRTSRASCHEPHARVLYDHRKEGWGRTPGTDPTVYLKTPVFPPDLRTLRRFLVDTIDTAT